MLCASADLGCNGLGGQSGLHRVALLLRAPHSWALSSAEAGRQLEALLCVEHPGQHPRLQLLQALVAQNGAPLQ